MGMTTRQANGRLMNRVMGGRSKPSFLWRAEIQDKVRQVQRCWAGITRVEMNGSG